MENGYAVWCSSKQVHTLQSLQYNCLRQALGIMDKSSQQSVERLAQVLPLDIKLDKTLILTFINILRRPDSFNLKNIIKRLLSDSKHLDHRIITPIHKYIMAKRNLMDFDPEKIEPHTTETIQDIARLPPTLAEMKSDFGKSGDRTSEQALAAKQEALSLLCVCNLCL